MPNPFFDHPILNSPYECPLRHWELDEAGQPTQKIVESRRSAKFITPIPKPKKRPADTHALPTPDELTNFFRELRHAGYRLDPRQLAAAHRLLLSAYGSGAQPNASRPKTLLAPVFVTSPAQQADFYRRFEAWLSQRSAGLIDPPKADPKPPIDPNSDKRWRLIAGCALLVTLGAGTWWALHKGQSTAEVTKTKAPKELPPDSGQFFFLPGQPRRNDNTPYRPPTSRHQWPPLADT
jgi:hypothetical protein